MAAVCYIERNGTREAEKHPLTHVRGPSKVYRRECWQQIGGLVKHLGWDTIDEIKAQYYGWRTRSYPELPIIHHRITGGNTGSLRWAIKLGQSDYYVGYHPLFVIAKYSRRVFIKPYLIGGLGALYGYFRWFFSTKHRRYNEKKIISYLQKEQIKCMMFRPSIYTRK